MATPFEPGADCLDAPKGHVANTEVGLGQAPGGALAFEGSPTHPDGVGQLVESKGHWLDSGPVIGLTSESVADQQKDGAQLGQSLMERNHPLGKRTAGGFGRGRVNGTNHGVTPFRSQSLGGNGTTK
jgi:hypothetical protein